MIGNFFAGNEEEAIENWKKLITQALNHVNQFRRLFDSEEQYCFY